MPDNNVHKLVTRPARHRRLMAAVFGFGFVFVGLLIGILLSSDDRPVAGAGGSDGKLGGDFTLQSADGEVSLADFRGQVVVLYFGFLNCPEVCPTSMGMIRKTLNKLTIAELNQVQPILVSVDPKRDTVQDLEDFSDYFHQKIIGVTGSPDAIDAVARDYGAYFKITQSETPDSEYAFEHTSRYYVINQQGELVDAMRHSTTANELAARIRKLMPTSSN